jgi:branched-chain amino acid transport system substrate-binding protein
MREGRDLLLRHTHGVAVAALVALLATAPAGAAELTIGELHPLTGPSAFYGVPMSHGIQLAIDQVNAAGGLKVGNETYRLRLESGDDQASGVAGVAALKKLIAGGVKFVIGPQSSPVASAIKPIVEATPSVVQIVDGSTANGIANGRNSFRTTVTAATYDAAVLKIADMQHYASVVLMTNRLAAGFMDTQHDLEKALDAAGHHVLAQEFFKVGDTDFSAQVTRVLSFAPAALVLRDAPAEDALITKQARQLGYKGQIMWEVNAPASTVVKNITDADMNGVMNGLPPHTDDYIRAGVPAAVAMGTAYRQRFGADPGENTAISYDSANILFAAIRKAGSVDPAAVAAALRGLHPADVPGLVGRFQPQDGGLLFKDGQASLPTLAQVWRDGGWHVVAQ